jgi:hypothetical protein
MAATGGRIKTVEDLDRVEMQLVVVAAIDDEYVEDFQHTLFDLDFDTASVLHTHNCKPVAHNDNEHDSRER